MDRMSGETSIQLLVPLIFLLIIAGGFAYAMPALSDTLVLVLGGGIVLFIICVASTEAAIYALIFSMLLSPEIIVGSTEGASLGRGITLRADDFFILIIAFSWLAKMAIFKERGLFLRTPLNRPIAYYITACLISTLLGSVFGKVDLKTGFFFVLKYFEYVFIYFMVVNHLESKKQVRRYLYALLFVCTVVSIIGISQIPGGGRVSAPFEGEVGEPNTLGGYLVFMICITAGLFLKIKSSKGRLICGLLAAAFLIPLIYTQSRSSYLAISAAVLGFVWLSEKRQWILMAAVLAGVVLIASPNPMKARVVHTFTQAPERGQVTIAGVRLDTSTSARIAGWRNAVKDWASHPILGYGVTGYRFVDTQYARVLVETGIVGFVTFFTLIFAIFRQGYGALEKAVEPLEEGLCMGFLAGFLGLLAHGIGANTFIIVRIMEPFWFVLAMVVMLPRLKSQQWREEKKGATIETVDGMTSEKYHVSRY